MRLDLTILAWFEYLHLLVMLVNARKVMNTVQQIERLTSRDRNLNQTYLQTGNLLMPRSMSVALVGCACEDGSVCSFLETPHNSKTSGDLTPIRLSAFGS